MPRVVGLFIWSEVDNHCIDLTLGRLPVFVYGRRIYTYNLDCRKLLFFIVVSTVGKNPLPTTNGEHEGFTDIIDRTEDLTVTVPSV